MKSIFIAICLWVCIVPSKAQVLVPDFSFFDFYQLPNTSNDTPWHLYDFLDSGKVVYFFVFEAMEAGWAYHNTNTLQNFYNTYGPNGSNTAMVFGITILDWGGVQGLEQWAVNNWIEGTPYPIIYNYSEGGGVEDGGSYVSDLSDLLDINTTALYSVYHICPDRSLTLLDTFPTYDELVAQMSNCTFAAQANDARLLSTGLDLRPNCRYEQRPVPVILSNLGTQPLTSCTFTTTYNGTPIQTYAWTGNLSTYQSDTVWLNDVVFHGDTAAIKITTYLPNGQPDGNTSNDTLQMMILPAKVVELDTIIVDVFTDGYGPQLYWDIKDDNGVTIDSGGNIWVGFLNGAGAPVDIGSSYQDYNYYHHVIPVSPDISDCLSVRVLSGYGYGVCCAYGNGYVRFKQDSEILYEFTDFGRRAYAKIQTNQSLLPPPIEVSYAVIHTANGLPNGSIIVTATDGLPPYQYSNDCGANFGNSNEFSNLAAGTYCMVTKDAIGQTVTDSVVVNSSLSATDAPRGLSGLSVRPNPAKDIISVGFALTQSGNVGIAVYNAIGQQVAAVPTRTYSVGQQAVPIDVAALPIGLYFVVVHDERGTSTTRFVKR